MKRCKFSVADFEIEVDVREGTNMMVNATKIGVLLGLDVNRFTEYDRTSKFVKVCMYGSNPGYLGIRTYDDLIYFEPEADNTGTWWMHSLLALKFIENTAPGFIVALHLTINKVMREYESENPHESAS